MNKRYVAESNLLTQINAQYAIKGERIRLYRTSQGRVFFIQTPTVRKVFKLYRPTVTDAAIQTTRVITYLDNCDYPIVKIIPTTSGELYVNVEQPEGICVGVLFEYASGIAQAFILLFGKANVKCYRQLDVTIPEQQQRLIDGFLNAVHLYDDKIILTYNYKEGCKTISLHDIMNATDGSDMSASDAPQKRTSP